MDRAAIEVDEAFVTHFDTRRRHREVCPVLTGKSTASTNTSNRLAQGSRSGTLPSPRRLNTPPFSRTPCVFDLWVYSRSRLRYMKTSVGFFTYVPQYLY